MPRYFTEKINAEDLEEKIKSAITPIVSSEELEYLRELEGITNLDGLNVKKILDYASQGYLPHNILTTLTPAVEKDLSKVEFNLENLSAGDDFNNSGLCGYNTLEYGLTFFGFEAGGDWEIPVFSLIYWNGKELRGYIPEDGNLWNTETHSAYGNDFQHDCDERGNPLKNFVPLPKSDQSNMLKRFNTIEWNEIKFDREKIIQDIKQRILKK